MKPLIVGLGGTTRAGSTFEQALHWGLSLCESKGATAQFRRGQILEQPDCDSGNRHRSLAARRLVDGLSAAVVLLISTPACLGGPSRMIKNTLDYTLDMARTTRPYVDMRPVGQIVTVYGRQAMGTTSSVQRSVVHALRGWPTAAAAALNGLTDPFGPGGTSIQETAALPAAQVAGFAQQHSKRPVGPKGEDATRL
jgi:FMN reductase